MPTPLRESFMRLVMNASLEFNRMPQFQTQVRSDTPTTLAEVMTLLQHHNQNVHDMKNLLCHHI